MTFYKLKAHPGAGENRLARKSSDSFEVWIKEPAELGRANAAALRLLARELEIESKRLRIVKGGMSPNKIVALLG